MGVSKYQVGNGTFWMVDEWLPLPNGQVTRFRKRKIPTKEQAVALVAKARAEAFEGRYFDRPKASKLLVEDAWKAYQPISKRDNDTWKSEEGRAKHLNRHLGQKLAAGLTVKEVKLLHKPNVRRSVLDDAAFGKLLTAAEAELKPIILVAYDTGMRLREVLGLRWSQVNLKLGVIKLSAEDTKTEEPRTVFLTSRVQQALEAQPRHIKGDWVFTNPETEEAWKDIRKVFHRACKAVKLTGVWFHDLRRSFVTNARRRGVPESVVMRMSGHRTRSVFERYNIVEEDDLREAVKRIEAGIPKSSGISGQDLDKVKGG